MTKINSKLLRPDQYNKETDSFGNPDTQKMYMNHKIKMYDLSQNNPKEYKKITEKAKFGSIGYAGLQGARKLGSMAKVVGKRAKNNAVELSRLAKKKLGK